MKTGQAMLAGVVVVAAVFVTFGRTIHFDFVGGWDDGPLIVDNPMINPPTADGFRQIWTHAHQRMFIPVVYSTWWTLAKFATVPGDPPGTTTLNSYVFHAANLIVHATSALIVFAILRLLVRRDWPSVAGALVFALHPLQVEPVAWATGMKDVLSGMLALAGMWQYLCFTTMNAGTETLSRKRRMHYAVASFLFILALLAKPSCVVVPFMLVASECLILCRPIARVATTLGPWIAMSAIWMIATAWVQPTPELVAPPLLSRVMIAANALGFYVMKLMWPMRLGVDYGLKPEILARAYLFIIAVAAAGLIAMARKRWLTASALIFAIALAPTLGLKPFVFEWLSVVADRYAYLALVGVAIAVAIFLAELRRIPAWLPVIAIAGLGTLSILQSGVWASGQTLMEHALAVNPKSPVAHNQLGDIAFHADDLTTAQAHFAAAIAEAPQYLVARDNLAITLWRSGQPDAALVMMKETLAIRRALPEAIAQPIDQDLMKIATLLSRQGRDAEAAAYREELAAIRSRSPSRQR